MSMSTSMSTKSLLAPAPARPARDTRPLREALLDRLLFRHPFEGSSARRYAARERPAFGDLDDRLIAGWRRELSAARTFLDCGAGPATFGTRLAIAHPHLAITCVEPSHDLAQPRAGLATVRACAESMPLARASFDLALCLSSIRHVRDRARAFAELRRVVRPGGALWIVELDPDADATRCANHADHLGSRALRWAFRPLVVRTAPTAAAVAEAARDAGWHTDAPLADPVQPVYLMKCT
jgi:SAM-dependent methyltransferase